MTWPYNMNRSQRGYPSYMPNSSQDVAPQVCNDTMIVSRFKWMSRILLGSARPAPSVHITALSLMIGIFLPVLPIVEGQFRWCRQPIFKDYQNPPFLADKQEVLTFSSPAARINDGRSSIIISGCMFPFQDLWYNICKHFDFFPLPCSSGVSGQIFMLRIGSILPSSWT